MPESLVLAIETSNPSAAEPPQGSGAPLGSSGVALGLASDGRVVRVLGVEPLRPLGPHHDDLMSAIDRLTSNARVRPEDLGTLAISIGPGGYTGLRIAVATAKMIAEVTGARCVPVESAAVGARRASATGRFAVALASKNDAAWIQVFERSAGEAPRPADTGALRGAADLDGLGVSTLIGDRFLPADLRARAAALGIAFERLVLDPVACLELGVAGDAVDPLALAPLYAREPEAVTKWRQLHGPKI